MRRETPPQDFPHGQRPRRFQRWRLPVAVVTAALAVASVAAPTAAQGGSLDLALETVATGLDEPVAVAHAGDDRLFVVEKPGRIVIVRDGAVVPEPFLDITDRVGDAGSEQGLLSVAFHPEHSGNGWFFVHYTNTEGDTVVARYSRSADPDVADPASERVLLTVDQPFANHNGGQLAFGPDGRLYVGTGDGGGGFDPLCNAQDLENLLGKILRLDVDTGSGAPPYYSVPEDNPFAVVPLGPFSAPRGEIWAYGLRNPWRFSFDRLTGDLYVGDVGQSEREEIDLQPAGSSGGENYGWKVMEGDLCTGLTGGCDDAVPPCRSASFTAPILTYGHAGGRCSVTGGFVYRGGAIAGLDGQYLYADFCSGEIFRAFRRVPTDPWTSLATGLVQAPLTTFGEDADGELYVASLDGTLSRITGPAPPPEPCEADATTLCLHEGRFSVRATFRVGDGATRRAEAEPVTGDTGYFWFFDSGNVEVVVKVLDGCPVNGRYWVFAAGLTDVESELVITDTLRGGTRRYPNPFGRPFAPVQDTGAFATCP